MKKRMGALLLSFTLLCSLLLGGTIFGSAQAFPAEIIIVAADSRKNQDDSHKSGDHPSEYGTPSSSLC